MTEDQNKPQKAVEHTSMPSKADKRAEALRNNLKKRKAFINEQKSNKE